MVFSATALAEDWATKTNISNSSSKISENPAVAPQTSGRGVVAWTERFSSSDTDILVEREGSGGSWAQNNVSNNSTFSEFSAVAVDSFNNVYAVWDDNAGGNYEIWFRKFNGSSWEGKQNISNTPYLSEFPDIAVPTVQIIYT